MFLMAAFLLVGIAACNGGDETTTEAPATDAPTGDDTTTVGSSTEPITTEDSQLEGYDYPTGLYNYKFQTSEVRHTFMAAAEKFLMNTMYGGVPLFANGGFNLYSSRLQLPVDSFIPIMGYGTAFGTMTADDSTVLMADGESGRPGAYTYRTTTTTNPGTWNQWLYDTSTDSDMMGIYMDMPYTYQFNAAKTGYELLPSMFADNPDPIATGDSQLGDPVETDNTAKGTVYKTWQFTVKDGLEWFYHPDTDMAGITDDVIDANDFVDTYKLALKEGWFRAVSGGGDFLNQTTGIVGAEAYNDDPTEANWANVGIKLIDDDTFEMTFINFQSDWNVRYFMGSFVMTPVHTEMVDQLGEAYGTTNTTIAYHGAYYVDYYEPDKTLVFAENPNYHTPDEFFYTGYEIQVIDDAAIRFQEFEAGKLEAIGLPTENYDDYKNHPGLKRVPGATTFRMMINSLGTVAEQQSQFPGSTYEPAPLLANDDFKMALFFAIDREYLAETVLKTSQTQMYYFSDAYLVEAEEGVPYRETDQGQTVGVGLAPGSNGYNKDAAVEYWNMAIEKLVDDGDYAEGDTIELDFLIFSGSEAQTLLGQYIKTTFEETFVNEDLGIEVIINVAPKDFPGIYYDYMMTGNFDLSIGGIAGSQLDAASFLDVFTDDNRGGFTLNWGIDTSTANIPVDYNDGVSDLQEVWSFNAIVSVLNGEAYFLNGIEADVPNAVIDMTSITPTGFEFSVDQFSNSAYEDLTYTITRYNQTTGAYDEVTGMVDIPVTTEDIEITGVNPYPYDYVVEINYKVIALGDDVFTTGSEWFYTEGLVDYSEMRTDEQSASIDVVFNNSDLAADTYRDIDAVEVYNSFDEDITGDVTVVPAQDADTGDWSINITGLDAGADYYIIVDTGEALTQEYFVTMTNLVFEFTTRSITDTLDIASTTSSTTFNVSLSANVTGATRYVEKLRVLDATMTELSVYDFTAVDMTRVQLTETGLVSGTTYYLEITSGDFVQTVAFETASIFASATAAAEVDMATINVEMNAVSALTPEIITNIVITDGDAFTETIDLSAFDLSNIEFELDGLTAYTVYTVTVTTDSGLTETFIFETPRP
jgi:ABC-type oligopeptide transport system substrate-binding subunit